MTCIANATTATEPESCEIGIQEETIRVAAEILFNEPLLDISEGWAEDLATRMLERALSRFREIE
jgi:hypothetical protein